MAKVPVQKGPIHMEMESYKNSSHTQRVKEREQELTGLKSGITLTLHTPKTK